MAAVIVESFALIVTMMLLISYFVTQNKGDRRGFIFVAMLLTNAVALVCDLITWVLEKPQYTLILYIANFLVFSLGYVMTGLFTAYLSCFISKRKCMERWFLPLIYSNCMLAILLVVVSLYNHMYFYVENGVLQYGKYTVFAVVYSLIIIILDMILVWLHRKELGVKNTLVFFFYGVIPTAAFIIQIIGIELTVTWLASTLTMLIIYIVVHISYVHQLKERELELSENRSVLMLSQIRPHFLFNTLNSIYHLCDIDAKKAQEAIGEFSEYLRENLSVLNQVKLTSFEMELAHVEHYVALEKMRFGEKVRVIYDIKESAFMIPALTVQPLVENAIKHGFGDANSAITICVKSEEEEEYYLVTVKDDGAGFDVKDFLASQAEKKVMEEQVGGMLSEKVHVGLKNVKNRLETMCAGKLEVRSWPGKGTTVRVKIPKK